MNASSGHHHHIRPSWPPNAKTRSVLFDQADVEEDKRGRVGRARYTATYAIKKGYFNLVSSLLAEGADANNRVDARGRTALIYAMHIRDEAWAVSVTRSLLASGADLSATDTRGLTALHYCCAYGRVALLRLMLGALDFDMGEARDMNGNTCVHYAVRARSVACVRALLEKYARAHLECGARVDAENRFGLRPSQVTDESSEEDGGKHDEGESSAICVCKDELLNFVKITSQLKQVYYIY